MSATITDLAFTIPVDQVYKRFIPKYVRQAARDSNNEKEYREKLSFLVSIMIVENDIHNFSSQFTDEMLNFLAYTHDEILKMYDIEKETSNEHPEEVQEKEPEPVPEKPRLRLVK